MRGRRALIAFIYFTGVGTKALPVVVYGSMTFDHLALGGIYASTTAVAFSAIILVLLRQRQFIRRLTIDGLQG